MVSSNLPLLLSLITFFAAAAASLPALALDLGLHANVGISLGRECSRTCESSFCNVAPLLRYGKYCGVLYGGCPGEKPCDGLDACCMKHDACILSKKSKPKPSLQLDCVANFKKARGKSFAGNTCKADEVINVITVIMNAALLASGHLPKP